MHPLLVIVQNFLWMVKVTSTEQNEAETIAIGNLRSLDLPVEDNQLLTKQRIFNNQIGATAGQVRQDAGDQ
jgi:hypothetical protein